MAEKTGFRDSALRAIAIIGLIAILVLGAWGIIQLVLGLPDFFSNFGGGPSATQSPTTTTGEQVSVTAPSMTTATQPFTLSWSHTGSTGNYSYAVSYACADGLMFAAPLPTGQTQSVPCNTPFNFTNASGSMTLIPLLPNTPSQKQVTTTFTITANRLSDGKVTSSGTSSVVTVLPPRAATNGNTPSTGTTGGNTNLGAAAAAGVGVGTGSTGTGATTPVVTTPAGSVTTATAPARHLYGFADLAVRIISATPVNGRESVQFEITNVGTNVAQYGWEFTARLPLMPPYTYVSKPQQALYPGDHIVYTLGFDAPVVYPGYPYSDGCGAYPSSYQINPTWQGYGCSGYGSNVFSITADPQNLLGDYNRANNTATAQL